MECQLFKYASGPNANYTECIHPPTLIEHFSSRSHARLLCLILCDYVCVYIAWHF